VTQECLDSVELGRLDRARERALLADKKELIAILTARSGRWIRKERKAWDETPEQKHEALSWLLMHCGLNSDVCLLRCDECKTTAEGTSGFDCLNCDRIRCSVCATKEGG